MTRRLGRRPGRSSRRPEQFNRSTPCESEVIVPVLHSDELVGKAKEEYQAWASPGVELSVACVANGTRSIEVGIRHGARATGRHPIGPRSRERRRRCLHDRLLRRPGQCWRQGGRVDPGDRRRRGCNALCQPAWQPLQRRYHRARHLSTGASAGPGVRHGEPLRIGARSRRRRARLLARIRAARNRRICSPRSARTAPMSSSWAAPARASTWRALSRTGSGSDLGCMCRSSIR